MSKIMLIEDDRTMVDLLKTLLSIEGYEVVAFHGTEELLPAIRRENPDVILLDVNLKNLGVRWESGFELLTALREDQDLCRIGVIISSGMNYQEESRTAGADGFIMKPYMPDDLLNLIKTTLS
jgi:DNA-binding response OmpR family regulator